MKRQHVTTGTEWEPRVGYSRAIRVGDGGVGDRVLVSGTTATDDDGDPVHEGDPYRQASHVLDIIADALRDAGATMSDVVRTRVYLADANDWQEVGRAHSERFGDIRPASSMLEVGRLVGPEYLVEVEAEAVVGSVGDGVGDD